MTVNIMRSYDRCADIIIFMVRMGTGVSFSVFLLAQQPTEGLGLRTD